MEPKNLSFEEIKVGDSTSFNRSFTLDDVVSFSKLSGDENPLHTDEGYAKTTKFGQRLVHGMLLGSLCSRFVGMYIPGKSCLYLGQNLSFKNPVFIGDTIEVTGAVTSKSESTRILSVYITMKKGNDIVVEGEAHVQVI